MERSHADDFAAALLDPALSVTDIIATSGDDRRRRLSIYRNNVVSSLIDALASTFAVTRALVGDDFFRAMARLHVAHSPPRSPVLALYGEHFPAFIARFEPARALGYLPDVARLDWLRVQAYHAADAQPLPRGAFESLLADPERLLALRIELHPACGWLASAAPVVSIWNEHQSNDPSLAGLDLGQAEAVLVFRPGLEVQQIPLPPGGAQWLDALARGDTLAHAFADAATDVGTPDLPRLLGLLIEHGLAIRFLDQPGDNT
jgi:hypothetical protein